MTVPFNIPVPTTINLSIRHCQAIPYKSFTPASEGDIESTAHGVVRTHCSIFSMEMWRLVMPGVVWNDLKTNVSNPAYYIAVMFKAGKNGKRLGYPPGTEFYIINDIIYKRVTWKEVGFPRKECGLTARVNRKNKKNFTHFLKECNHISHDLRLAIFSGLEKAIHAS